MAKRVTSSTKSKPRTSSKRKSQSAYRQSIFTARTITMGIVVLAVVAIGIYTIVASFAASGRGMPPDELSRGQSWKGLAKASDGHCGDAYVLEEDAGKSGISVPCVHPDPGPPGQDVRVRAGQIEAQLNAQVNRDQQTPPTPSNAPPTTQAQQDAYIASYSLGSGVMLGTVAPRMWPCTGTGTDGNRIQMMYVYPANLPSRFSTFHSGFISVAQRMNAVLYNSAVLSGDTNGEQLRFATTSGLAGCGLSIGVAPITGDINSFSNIATQLQARGFTAKTRKFQVWVDNETVSTSRCGLSMVMNDDRYDATLNYNNVAPSSGSFGMVWYPCWNYGEPHELMHQLGGVQLTAPHHTPANHCTEQYDIMCYKDVSTVIMTTPCPTASLFSYDCHFDDYYNAASTITSTSTINRDYIKTHWNVARSYFVYR